VLTHFSSSAFFFASSAFFDFVKIGWIWKEIAGAHPYQLVWLLHSKIRCVKKGWIWREIVGAHPFPLVCVLLHIERVL
jgi:hypothetical protein